MNIFIESKFNVQILSKLVEFQRLILVYMRLVTSQLIKAPVEPLAGRNVAAIVQLGVLIQGESEKSY